MQAPDGMCAVYVWWTHLACDHVRIAEAPTTDVKHNNQSVTLNL